MSLPTPPLRSDGPATFADRGDAFMAALPTFESDMNALSVSVTAKEASASDSAAAALASEISANAAVGATKWVSGTTYAIGDPRWSPANSLSYRRRTPGAGSTDPSLDPTNWQPLNKMVAFVAYDNRANLRTTAALDGDLISVSGLGLFAYTTGVTELDDDATCFVTASGVWLLIAADPDYVFGAWVAGVDDLDHRITTIEHDYGSILRGSFTMSLTSLAAISSSNFTVTIPGAAVDDSVVVNPGNSFGTSGADQGKLSYVAYVSATDTAIISIRNASASTANMTASTWPVLVIKQ